MLIQKRTDEETNRLENCSFRNNRAYCDRVYSLAKWSKRDFDGTDNWDYWLEYWCRNTKPCKELNFNHNDKRKI